MSPRPVNSESQWVPDRGDVIWIDHNPQAGREMRDHHAFAVLSPASFNRRVGLVVGCAMSSAAYNQGSSLSVDLGPIEGLSGYNSYILCQQIKSFDWRARGAKLHPMGKITTSKLSEVQEIVGQILGLFP